MKIPEQRLSRLSALVHAVQIGVQRIGQFARAAGRIERIGRTIEVRPHFQDEVIPCVSVPFRACAREREILQMKR